MAQMEFIALKSLKKAALSALMFATLTVAAGTVYAGAAPTTPCDPEFMDALEARAWMEAQREISQNQNLIVKPDSVLEYVCFDKILDALGSNASFSDGGGTPAGTTAGTLSDLVGQSAGTYVQSNFGHTWLGGRAAGNSVLDNGPYTVQSGGTYACNNMARVWQLAKCMNMFDKPAHDGFFDFQWYSTNDPRRLPTTPAPLAACTAPALFGTTPAIAFNGQQARYMLNPENPNDAAQYTVDNVTSYFGLIDPGQCGDPNIPNSDQGIPTGVQITRPGFNPATYEDHVCPNPGCYYDPNARRCVNN
jgi:hypothetical protein